MYHLQEDLNIAWIGNTTPIAQGISLLAVVTVQRTGETVLGGIFNTFAELEECHLDRHP